jgi:hypothetical protein
MAKKDLISQIFPTVKDLPIGEARRVADLDWTVQAEKLGGMDTGREIDSHKALFTSDNRLLGVVGSDYQSSEVDEFVSSSYDLANFVGYPVSKLGFIPSKSIVTAFIDLKPMSIKDDKLNVGILIQDGFNGLQSRSYSMVIIREICQNGMVKKHLCDSLGKTRHSKNFESNHSNRFKLILNSIEEQIARMEVTFENLYNTTFDRPQFDEFTETLLPALKKEKPSKQALRVKDQLENLFVNGTGTNGITKWDAYNAVTEFCSHEKTYKQTSSSPDENRFADFTKGNGFPLAEKALQLLSA